MKWNKFKGMGVFFAFTFLLMCMIFRQERVRADENQRAIAKEIIRLHVLANSDSDEDQKLKMKVKDDVVEYLREAMREVENVEQARAVIESRLAKVEQVAVERMEREGYHYTATATLGESYFPVKEYGEMTFPAGNYEALRVELGKSEGHNWWCVMYPGLCFIDSTYQVVPEESKEKLKNSLTEEEYNSLLDGGSDITYSSKIIEWIQKLW